MQIEETMKNMRNTLLTMLGFLILFINKNHVTDGLDSDAESNQVTIKFQYSMKREWSTAVLTSLQQSLVNYANSFCITNKTACGMSIFKFFVQSNVVISPGYPREILSNTLISLYIKLPKGSTKDIGDFVLRKSTLAKIVKDNHADLKLKLRNAAETKLRHPWTFTVMKVNGIDMLPTPDETLNIVLSCVIVGLLLVLAIIVFILECQSRKHHKRHLARAIEEVVKAKEVRSRTQESSTSNLSEVQNENVSSTI